MFLKKLLIWCVSFLCLVSCVSVDRQFLLKEFYVIDIPNIEGMMLKNSLLHYFNNQNVLQSKYLIKAEITINNVVDLRDKYGIESQGKLDLTLKFSIIDAKSNLILLSRSNSFSETYLSGDTFYQNRANKDRAQITLIKQAVLYIVYEVYGFLQLIDKEKEKLKTMCLIGSEEIANEDSAKSDFNIFE